MKVYFIVDARVFVEPGLGSHCSWITGARQNPMHIIRQHVSRPHHQPTEPHNVAFKRMARRPNRGGRRRIFSLQQEMSIVNIVRANNAIRLHQLRAEILADQGTFQNVNQVSISTLRRILEKRSVTMKQLYRVPFERNEDRVKELRRTYVQRVLDMDGADQIHEFIFIDEAGFNLSKNRRRGRNIIGQRAIVHGPGQRGGNITLCAAISLRGLLHHHCKIGAYNAQNIIAFLDALHFTVVQDRPDQPRFVVIWDNVSFHRAALVRDWFDNHNLFDVMYLPPYSPFLNPIEEFFSAWRWRVYDHQPHARVPLLQAMNQACGDIDVQAIQAWIRHSRAYFPRCLAREDIACDVDEVMWPDANRRQAP
ncbi:uncharacterized protein LOC132900766 isoform X2 [Neoarius graeffei]|uniref:uncharacterized protein LOC132900766 isoform X2 n=1 Tax=Neoarius graeffei TaxID=443677 RepID=UPI00298D0FDA|nr:uncharacterized protein LOC132900766 isoform X2 [Neoarius graeffei]